MLYIALPRAGRAAASGGPRQAPPGQGEELPERLQGHIVIVIVTVRVRVRVRVIVIVIEIVNSSSNSNSHN